MIDISEILIHWHAGRSQNQIAASLGVDRRTIRKYTAAAIVAGMCPGGPPVSEERWAELARGWFPELADTRLRQVTWPAIAEHHEFITGQLEAGVTMATVHQRLRDPRGAGGVGGQLPPVCGGQPAGGGAPLAGAGAAPEPG